MCNATEGRCIRGGGQWQDRRIAGVTLPTIPILGDSSDPGDVGWMVEAGSGSDGSSTADTISNPPTTIATRVEWIKKEGTIAPFTTREVECIKRRTPVHQNVSCNSVHTPLNNPLVINPISDIIFTKNCGHCVVNAYIFRPCKCFSIKLS